MGRVWWLTSALSSCTTCRYPCTVGCRRPPPSLLDCHWHFLVDPLPPNSAYISFFFACLEQLFWDVDRHPSSLERPPQPNSRRLLRALWTLWRVCMAWASRGGAGGIRATDFADRHFQYGLAVPHRSRTLIQMTRAAQSLSPWWSWKSFASSRLLAVRALLFRRSCSTHSSTTCCTCRSRRTGE